MTHKKKGHWRYRRDITVPRQHSKTVVVTGSHSVGKTVLCEALVDSLSKAEHVGFIPEMARVLIAQGIPMNDKVSESGIIAYIVQYLRCRRYAQGKIIVSDRSVFDLYAYISTSRPSDVRDEFVRLTEEVVRAEIATVDLYVYVPVEFAMVLDDVRPAATDYQKLIDATIVLFLRQFEANYITVTGTVEQRVQQIVSAIGGC